MTVIQKLALGAGWLCFARYTSGLGSVTWQLQAKSAFTHCGHSCCLTARTYPRIQMDAGTPAPSAKPSSALPFSCCSLLCQPGSPLQQPWDKHACTLPCSSSSRDEAAERKPTESTAAESTSSFCPPRVIPRDRTQVGISTSARTRTKGIKTASSRRARRVNPASETQMHLVPVNMTAHC